MIRLALQQQLRQLLYVAGELLIDSSQLPKGVSITSLTAACEKAVSGNCTSAEAQAWTSYFGCMSDPAETESSEQCEEEFLTSGDTKCIDALRGIFGGGK